MKTYLEISIAADEDARQLLIPTMIRLGCSGFQETDSALYCYLERSDWNEEKLSRFTSAVSAVLGKSPQEAGIVFKEIQEEDWNSEWERSIQPIEVGRRFVIKPTWSSYDNRAGRIVLEIDPKMSFGTGYHETTRLMLRLLEEHLAPGSRVADVGTGTGILAIAAAKLGASSVLGIDIDEWSIDNARENVLLNGVGSAVSISPTPVEELRDADFDMIAANLTLNTNSELLSRFHRILRHKGTLLLSGFFRDDLETMHQRLTAQGFTLIDSPYENEWLAITARRRS